MIFLVQSSQRDKSHWIIQVIIQVAMNIVALKYFSNSVCIHIHNAMYFDTIIIFLEF